MATNWPQQLNPRAWRSARCSRTARSNSVRENNCNIWLKILDTRITAVLVLPMVHVFSTQTVAEFYRRRSKANLDKSGRAVRAKFLKTSASTTLRNDHL